MTRDPDRPLRIGYIGGDFKFHSAAMAFAPIVCAPSADMQTFCYNTLPRAEYDDTTAYFKRTLGTRLIDASDFSPKALAHIIRTDRIDILIDLSGSTPYHRRETFALRPAPLQLKGWGYVTDEGEPWCDGLLADAFVAPPAMRTSMQTRIVDLPCVLTNLLRPGVLRCGPRTGLPVFGIFQRAQKFTVDTCRVWARLLRTLPTATLLIASSQEYPGFRARVRALMGDVADRLTFANPTTHPEHMARHNAVDLLLDTWPQSGGCSSLEALWMGVPIVTLLGDQIMQRTTGSCLHLLGLDDFIAHTEDDYVAIATTAIDRARAVRASLPARLLKSPIIDGYVEAVHRAYRHCWREYCAAETKDNVA